MTTQIASANVPVMAVRDELFRYKWDRQLVEGDRDEVPFSLGWDAALDTMLSDRFRDRLTDDEYAAVKRVVDLARN